MEQRESERPREPVAGVLGLRTVQAPAFAAALRTAGVRHGFSTRIGGVSSVYARAMQGSEPAGELNLGFTATDAREHVLGNREQLLRDVFGASMPLVTLRQVHAATVYRVGPEQAGEEASLTGDGLFSGSRGLALGIQTADCVPVLVADRVTGAVAGFHAGWRGTVARVVEQGVARLLAELGSRAEDLVAAIGPAIGPCCYTVGDEVRQAYDSTFRYAAVLFHAVGDQPKGVSARGDAAGLREGRVANTGTSSHARDAAGSLGEYRQRALSLRLDLKEANRRQLVDAGLAASAIEVLPFCSSCRTDLFFSYRAEAGSTGRMMAVIGRP